MSASDQQVKQQFWSIERVVAFVIAPIVTPLSGALALWLGRHFPGVHVSGDAIYAFAATTAGGVAGSFIKWLDGRQKFVAHVGVLEGQVGHLAEPIYGMVPEHERAALLKEIEGIVSGHTAKLAKYVEGVVKSPPPVVTSSSVGHQTIGEPEPAPPNTDPWEAPNDPAPAETPAPTAAQPPGSINQTTSPAQPSAAESGAAITGS